MVRTSANMSKQANKGYLYSTVYERKNVIIPQISNREWLKRSMDLLKIEYYRVISNNNAHFIFTDMIYY